MQPLLVVWCLHRRHRFNFLSSLIALHWMQIPMMAAPTRSSCFSHRSDLQPLLNLQFSTWSTCHRWILEKTFAKWQQVRCPATILLDSNSNSCNELLLSMTPLDRLGAVGIQVSIKRALNYAVGEPEGSLALSSRPVDLGVFGPFLQRPFLGQSAAALPECLLYLVVCFTWLLLTWE